MKSILKKLNNLSTRMHTKVKQYGHYYVVKTPDWRFVDVMGETVHTDPNLCKLNTRTEAKLLREQYINGQLLVKPDSDDYLYLTLYVIFAAIVGTISHILVQVLA